VISSVGWLSWNKEQVINNKVIENGVRVTNKGEYGTTTELSTSTSSRFGYYSALLTTVITGVTFGFAITAIPISGVNCPENCVEYPYLDTVSQFPRDFLWMPLAIVLVLAYVTLMVSIHSYASSQKKIFSQVGLSFALIAAVILAVDYYIQFSVIPMSLMNNETEGLAVLIQYNPHGVFLALEELGYLVMSLSFLFMAPVFTNRGRLESAVGWVFVIAFILAIVSLTVISFSYGLDRQDRFEVAILSIDWLVLIINGVLLSIVFRRQFKAEQET
jgi:tetrahydromethanopterin S-methyltransferase subunit E